MIGVVGASARAAVMSLARAGHSAWAVDLFNDRDLKRIAPCARCSLADFPQAIPALAEQFPPGPVLYTGGLENYPEVIAELAQKRQLLGNGPDVLKRVRDPFALPLPRPEMLAAGETVPATGAWVVKSLRSSGGLGVRLAKPGEIVSPGHYLQEFIDGPAMSAVFRDRELIGVTEQLVGTPWLHAKAFHYAGTIASRAGSVSDGTLDRRLRFRLLGWFGIDFILNDGTPYVIEVNPRYPASLEAIEHANHLDRVVGKAIYFAPRSFRFPPTGPWDADLEGSFDPWRLPNFADIPEPGELMEAGSPVLTFFASGTTAEECRQGLQSRATELDHLFAGTHT